MKICDKVVYVGVNDHEIDLFEGQYQVPNGMAYNSYVILDQKVAVFDTVDARFSLEWQKNVENALSGRLPDYLIIQHMEPDHSGAIKAFMEKYPSATIVSTASAFVMMGQFFGAQFEDRRIVVKDGDSLSLGDETLNFVTAPMVHWPEVIFTYAQNLKGLFSADAFGKFGALDADEDWACEARRYYFGIVGKYGVQVQAVLKKLANFDIQTILPLHGPVLTENLGYYINLYQTWSTYGVESDGVAIFYTSVYGNTKKAVEQLQAKLIDKGCPKVAVTDLARDDMAEAVEDAFRYGKIVLATTTYNGEVFPFMREFINELLERGYKNRKIGVIENGTWSPVAGKYIKKAFENSKDVEFLDPTVTIRSALNENSMAQLEQLANQLL